MADSARKTTRTFKTEWFTKAARKAGLADVELCKAIEQLINNQGDDLGGGVFKKRLNKNMHRGTILAKARQYWVYAYLFAKKDRENIEDTELKGWRRATTGYPLSSLIDY